MASGLLLLVSSVLIGVAVGMGIIGSADAVDWLSGKYLSDLGERMERLGMDSRPLRGLLRSLDLLVWRICDRRHLAPHDSGGFYRPC